MDTRWSTNRERDVRKAEPLWPRLDGTAAGPEASAPGSREKEMPTMISDPAGQPPLAPAASPTSDTPTAPQAAQPAQAPAPGDARVSIDEFMKIELRVAKVLAAERVPKSKKLVKMQIDIGSEERTIVAGIAEAYPPESLVGRTIVVVANLKPAKLMGIESNGMVLAASPDGGLPVLLGLDQPLPPGTRVR
jgi:methionyl-tRNA synthetase